MAELAPVLSPLDWAVAAVLVLALLRGLVLGLVREVFSLMALAAAILSVRLLGAPFGEWLARETPAGLLGGRLLAAALLAAVSVAVVVWAGRGVGRGVRAAGLGFFDRLGGALLGLAEGVVVAALVLFGADYLLGSGHPALQDSRSRVVLERLRDAAEQAVARGRADVAARPPQRR